ncbi:uncharacterized protein [Ptychodera flava]|uniref:uncharacterized protein n=1 Tax=Ptychodera flava TaxID=63121 RepID=UPI00396A655E
MASSSRLSPRMFRRLNLRELTYDRINDDGILCIMSALLLKCKVELTKDILHEALQCLVKQHPILRATIKTVSDQDGKEKGRYYVEMENGGGINLHTSDFTDSEMQAALSLERKISLRNPGGHLWRCTLLRGHWVKSSNGVAEEYHTGIIFSIRHSAADGFSLVRYADLLIENINHILNETLSAKTCTVDKTSFPRPVEDLLGGQTAVESTQDPSAGHEHERSIDLKSCFRQVDVADSVDTSNSKYLLFDVPEYVKSNVDRLSKEHGANLNSTLMVVFCLSFLKVATDGKPIDYEAFPLPLAVSLRRYFEKSEANNLGVYESYLVVETNIDKNSFEVEGFWEIAHKVKEDIHKELNNKTPLPSNCKVGSDLLVKQVTDKLKNRAEYLANSTMFAVSNYGYLDFLERHKHGHVSFNGIYSMLAGALEDFEISILGFGGKLYITIEYEAEIVKSDKAEALKNEIIRMLENIS